MVQIFGSVERSTLINGRQRIVFSIPSFSRAAARTRARFNARVKGIPNSEITSVEESDTGTPGRKLFLVTVQGGR